MVTIDDIALQRAEAVRIVLDSNPDFSTPIELSEKWLHCICIATREADSKVGIIIADNAGNVGWVFMDNEHATAVSKKILDACEKLLEKNESQNVKGSEIEPGKAEGSKQEDSI